VSHYGSRRLGSAREPLDSCGTDPADGLIDEERDEHVRRLRAREAGGPAGETGVPEAAGARRWRGRVVAAVAAVAVVAGGLAAYSQDAGAAYQPTIAQVQSEVNSLQGQIDQVDEQYDSVTAQVTAAKARLASVQKQDAHDEALFLSAQASLRRVAVASYETANQSSIAGLLTAGNPAQVLQQASLLEELSNADGALVARYLGTAQAVSTAQQNVQRTEEGIAQLQVQLVAKKKNLEKLYNQSQAELDSLNLQQQEEVAAEDIAGGDEIITSATDPLPTNTPALKAVWFAYQQLGCPYVYAGNGPCADGFDCSGLMQQAYLYAGVDIDRTSETQYLEFPSVPKADLEPGDLVFFEPDSDGPGHVGMYVGNGMMIDSPSTGEVVRLHALDMQWYEQEYVGAVRPT
jgi:peptidoglycan DL-endopeptidase CwlO